jgi:YidC/Oxa1 family membrane protein insertase
MISLWNTLFYEPLYNALFFLVNHVPGNSLFFSIIILTIIVRLIISPLSYKAIRTQLKTKLLQPELKEIKKIEDKQEQAQATLALYKKHGINPFSSFFLLLIQLPIILALYWVFRDGGVEIDPSILYSFVTEPKQVIDTFLGFNLTEKSMVLAFLTGLTQYLYLSTASSMKKTELGNDASDQEKVMQSVQQSMKYIMPITITIFAYVIGGAVALYWLTSNVFMLIQEQYIQRSIKKNPIALPQDEE